MLTTLSLLTFHLPIDVYFCFKSFAMEVKIEPSWKAVLSEEFNKPYFKNLTDFVQDRVQYPKLFPDEKPDFCRF
jgi:uracil-DNA glycosylase